MLQTTGTVFRYDAGSSTVRKLTITVGGVRDNRLVVAEGIAAGNMLASAGVHIVRWTKGEAPSPGGAGAVNILTRFGLARSRFTIAAMISLLVAGIGFYPNFPKREDPGHRHPHGGGVGALSRDGARAHGKSRCRPDRAQDPRACRGQGHQDAASEGSLTIYVDLKDEIGNVNATWPRLRDKMGDVKVELPDGVIGPFVNSDFGDVAIATIAITARAFRNGN